VDQVVPAPPGQLIEVPGEPRLHPGTGLHVAITATNRGNHAAPYGTLMAMVIVGEPWALP
jgi:hypothetical protein